MKNQPFGILGGMGPEASLHFCLLLTKMTQVTKDQDHIPYILYNKPKIPDRTNAILNNGPSPLKELLAGIKVLEQCSCRFIVIPCNTAHYYREDLQKETKIPIINMIAETVLNIRKLHKKSTKIGLLATSGTIHSQIYQKAFAKNEIEVMIPEAKLQEELVMPTIYQIKKEGLNSSSYKLFLPAMNFLKTKGAKISILGCTEISLAFKGQKKIESFIDPMEVLAQKVISLYHKKERKEKLIE